MVQCTKLQKRHAGGLLSQTFFCVVVAVFVFQTLGPIEIQIIGLQRHRRVLSSRRHLHTTDQRYCVTQTNLARNTPVLQGQR